MASNAALNVGETVSVIVHCGTNSDNGYTVGNAFREVSECSLGKMLSEGDRLISWYDGTNNLPIYPSPLR